MPIKIDASLTAPKLLPKVNKLFEVSGPKLLNLEKSWDPAQGAPVLTVKGKYTSRSWTEWTQGFHFGSALLQFEATGEAEFLEIGRKNTFERMAGHLTHLGVHDHGFNNVSTYGNLLRLMRERRIPFNEREQEFYELALKVSGAVQASRWSRIADGSGFIYSFNGPHSLFIDTMRSLRALVIAHQLGHVLLTEHDERICLLQRALQHAVTTASYSIYYGQGRDFYDLRGRTAQECIFNMNDGQFRCPSSQQGYSPYTTWTRGLAWGLLGFAELLEFLAAFLHPEPDTLTGSTTETKKLIHLLEQAAQATADFALEFSCADGIPMWDSHAPNLSRLRDWSHRCSDPFNPWEPVDSSAAAIIAQGLLRLGHYLGKRRQAHRFIQAGLTIANTLFDDPYLSGEARHQGLILHSVYHRPNRWDYVAPGQKVPNGESSLWGDYHARELALMLRRLATGEHYLTFFDPRRPLPC